MSPRAQDDAALVIKKFESSPVSCCYGHDGYILVESGAITDYLPEIGSLDPNHIKLVGKGNKGMSAGFVCGSTVVRSHGCLTGNCQKPFYTPNHCRSKKCPECYPWWLSDNREDIG